MELRKSFTQVDRSQAEILSTPLHDLYAVEVKPLRSEVPAKLEEFVRGLLEIQSTWMGTKNASPIVTYEIQRPSPDRLFLQFLVPTKRMERKVRTQLSNQVPGVGFEEGETRLPVKIGDSIGGGYLTTGRKDYFPLRTDFDSPPINSLVAALHRHAMIDTKVVVQITFQPVAGEPLKESWRKRRGYQTVGFLRKEKEKLWGSRSPTPRERDQADAVERKMGQRRYWVSIRFALISAGEYTPSRIKELAGAFNVFENSDTGQYLDMVTLRSIRRKRFHEHFKAVKSRRFKGYSLRFQASTEELAALVSIPDRGQENLRKSSP